MKENQNLNNLELAPGYFLFNWLNEKDASNLDYRNLFIGIISNPPLIRDKDSIDKDEYDRSEFKIKLPGGGSKQAEGLGAAFLLDTIAISFVSDAFWDRPEIDNLKRYRISEEVDVLEDFVVIRHASRPGHIENHISWFENKRKDSLKKSKELWERRKEFFPNLELCGEVEHQLKMVIGIESSYFNQLYDRLNSLDTYAKNWTIGAFSESDIKKRYGLNVSSETAYTIKKYGSDRRFRLPDGRREIFKMHIKTGELRFHFFPDEKKHRIYVGYIGSHLRTVSN